MTDGSEPRRDVENGDYECSHCGGKANNILGEEHIWKCSKVVPVEDLEALADNWDREAESAPHPMCEEVMKAQCADELRDLIDDYRSGADE